MTAPRWRLVLNGKSAGDDALRAAVAAARERGVALDVRVTWEGGDAERYVGEAIHEGVDVIIAAGGDDHVHAFVDGFADVALGVAALPGHAHVQRDAALARGRDGGAKRVVTRGFSVEDQAPARCGHDVMRSAKTTRYQRGTAAG